MEAKKYKTRNPNVSNIKLKYGTVNKPCSSPIMIKRWYNERDYLMISFHVGFFNIPLIESIFERLLYAEVWQLRKLNRDPASAYADYLLILLKDFGKETEDTLTNLVDGIVKNVYYEETRIQNDNLQLIDLAKPSSQIEIVDRPSISYRTVEVLAANGIVNVSDLINLTREEICQISGMTTSEVFKLEKTLAARGMFLKTKIPSIPPIKQDR